MNPNTLSIALHALSVRHVYNAANRGGLDLTFALVRFFDVGGRTEADVLRFTISTQKAIEEYRSYGHFGPDTVSN